MTGSVVDGEDVVQETILKALRSSPVAEHFDAWVFGIARNAALDLLRRRARAERAMREHLLYLRDVLAMTRERQ